MLTLAVSKGKIFDSTLPLLQRGGFSPSREDLESRRLIMEANGIRLITLRGPDVTTYVSSGAVDAGIVGNDHIEEQDPDDMCVLADLGLSACRLVVAAPESLDYERVLSENARLCVATKYPRLAREHFVGRGVQVGIIKLYGSMEIAPAAGLADLIVDLSDTGRTLRENGLVEREFIMRVSSRLVCNVGAMKRNGTELNRIKRVLLAARDAA